MANQVATLGITAPGGVHDIEIRDTLINNLYQKTAFVSDVSTGAENTFGIYLTGVGTNVLIHDNAVNMVNTGIYVALTGSSPNTQVYRNVVANNKWGILTAQGSGISTGTFDYWNDVCIGTLWNTDFNNGDPYHTDGLFAFGQNSSVYMNGVYLYGNYIHCAAGSHNTTDGLYYCESGHIYANQNLQNLYIFNNVFQLTSGYSCGGMVTTGYGTLSQWIINNTFSGYGAAACNANNGGNTCTANADFGPNGSASTTAENNITVGFNNPVIYNHSGSAGFATWDYNLYSGWDNSGFPWCVGTTSSCANSTIYTCFQTSDGDCNFDNGGQANGPWNAVHDQHGNETNPLLTTSFHLTNSSSGAWQTGKNLYTFFGCGSPVIPGPGAACVDANNVARPTAVSGLPWDMGVYEDSASGGQASAPSCTPGSGTYPSTQTIACTNPNTGTTVACFTADGTTPITAGDGLNCTHGTKYTTTISVSNTETLQIIAGTSTETDSTVVSYAYLIPIQITYVNASTGNDTYDCSSATFVSAYVGPCLTVARGEAATTAGGIINIAAGTYRLTTGLTSTSGIIQIKNGQTLIGPACTPTSAACTPILSGSIQLCAGSYTCAGPDGNGNYSVTGMTQAGTVTNYLCDPTYEACNYPEDLFEDGAPIQHVEYTLGGTISYSSVSGGTVSGSGSCTATAKATGIGNPSTGTISISAGVPSGSITLTYNPAAWISVPTQWTLSAGTGGATCSGSPTMTTTGGSLVMPTLTASTWLFDYTNDIIYFHFNPSGHTVETSVLASAFNRNGTNDITVKNLTIEEFASPLQQGAISPTASGSSNPTSGANWIVQNNYVTLNHGFGIFAQYGGQILNNVATANGQFGMNGSYAPGISTSLSNIVMQGNTVTANNYAHASPSFGAGGINFGNTAGAVVRGNTVIGNFGLGIHFDVNSVNNLIDGNTVENNADPAAVGGSGAGIHCEISTGCTIRNNTIEQGVNGSSGLLIHSSSQVQAYCNVIEETAGANFLWQMLAVNRGNNTVQPNLGAYIVAIGNYVHHNTLIWAAGTTGQIGYFQQDTANQPNFFTNNTPPDFNTYHLPSTSVSQFVYDNNNTGNNTANNFTTYQGNGGDVHGTIDTINTSGFPTVNISSPADQANVTNPVTISATASDGSGIASVKFYVDWTLVSTVTGSGPYTYNWTNGLFGSHTIAAMALSNAGVQSCWAVTLNNLSTSTPAPPGNLLGVVSRNQEIQAEFSSPAAGQK